MNSKRESVLVGLFVLVALAMLIAGLLAVSGSFGRPGIKHYTYFKSAAGLTPGAMVRYAGMKAGKVEVVRVDPQDTTRIEVKFTVQPDIPVKTNSIARISTLGALSDNYVEVGAGTKDGELAPPGSELKSVETIGFADIGDIVGGLAPVATDVLHNLNQRLSELQVTIARVNDLLNDKNRANVGGSLNNLNAVLADSRPKVAASLANIQAASAKINPLLDNLKVTMGNANTTLSHVDALVVENREDIRAIVIKLRETMITAQSLIEDLKTTTETNSDNIDEIVENIRVTTENMKELTERLKSDPSVLIRGENVKDRKPGSN
jgi:phospholipid/cholesterol/gamma-HCH transport system substrate-binding protein